MKYIITKYCKKLKELDDVAIFIWKPSSSSWCWRLTKLNEMDISENGNIIVWNPHTMAADIVVPSCVFMLVPEPVFQLFSDLEFIGECKDPNLTWTFQDTDHVWEEIVTYKWHTQ